MIDVLNTDRFFMQLGRHGGFAELCLYLLENSLNRRPNYCDDWSFIWFFLEQTHQEFFYRRPYALIPHLEWHFQDLTKDLLIVLPRIEGSAVQHLIQNDAQRPHINSIGVIVKLGLFGSDILFSSSYGLHDDLLSAEPEICQLDEGDGFTWSILCF